MPFREHTFAIRSTNLERLAPLATQAARSVDLADNPPQPFSRRPSRSRKLSLLRRRKIPGKILPEIRKGPFWADTEPVIRPMTPRYNLNFEKLDPSAADWRDVFSPAWRFGAHCS